MKRIVLTALFCILCGCHNDKSGSESSIDDTSIDSAPDTDPDTSEDSRADTADDSDSGTSEDCTDERYTEPDARILTSDFLYAAVALGDFNGDGHQDWGTAFAHSGLTGHLIPGPATSGEFSDADFPGYVIQSGDDPPERGSLGRTGDVDGNGVDDIILGGWLFLGPVTSDIDRSDASVVFGQIDYVWFESPRNPGDVDDDGLMDVLLGSPYGTGDFGGRAFLVTDAGPPHEGTYDVNLASAIIRGDPGGSESGDLLGETVAFAGDTNGDGYGDILLSYEQRGAYAFFDGPLAGEFTPHDAYASIYTEIHNTAPPYGGEDMNGDGVDDIIITTYCVGIITGPVGAGDLEACTSDIVFSVDGSDMTDAAPGGDIDGDGTMDLLVASPGTGDVDFMDTVVRIIPGPLEGHLTVKDVSQSINFCPTPQPLTHKAVSKAEDLDSNGLPDILATAGPRTDGAKSAIYLLFGESL